MQVQSTSCLFAYNHKSNTSFAKVATHLMSRKNKLINMVAVFGQKNTEEHQGHANFMLPVTAVQRTSETEENARAFIHIYLSWTSNLPLNMPL